MAACLPARTATGADTHLLRPTQVSTRHPSSGPMSASSPEALPLPPDDAPLMDWNGRISAWSAAHVVLSCVCSMVVRIRSRTVRRYRVCKGERRRRGQMRRRRRGGAQDPEVDEGRRRGGRGEGKRGGKIRGGAQDTEVEEEGRRWWWWSSRRGRKSR